MHLSFDLINSLVIHPYNGVDDPRLKKNLLEISKKFTQERQLIADYVETDELVSAYTLFYFPTGFVKFDWLMNRLPENLTKSFKDMNFIDVGSGPGTYACAFLSFVGEPFDGEIKLIEPSISMLKQAKQTVSKLFPNFSNLRVATNFINLKKKILFFGNSFNEMGSVEAGKLIKEYDPEVIIFLEPGTKEVFGEIISFRDEILQRNYHQVYPCPSHDRCPMKNSHDWCHQVMSTTHEKSIEQLSQILHKDRRTMPLIAHVYSKEKYSTAFNRIVRIFPETKFSYEFQLCQNNQISKFETMKKLYKKEDKRFIEELSVGDEMVMSVDKTLNDGKLRGVVYSSSSTKK
jgi:ribosomal protein RSM22 (predicted rRNA methylase)